MACVNAERKESVSIEERCKITVETVQRSIWAALEKRAVCNQNPQRGSEW